MIRERLGIAVAPVAPGAVWVHAASVGEVAAAEPLVRRIEGAFLTADTPAGVEAARRIGVAQALPAVLAPLWADARPRAIIWVEGVFWPHLGAAARRDGVPQIRVNARAGRGIRRWGRLAWPDLAVCVGDDAARWYVERGVPAVVAGDLKGDRPAPASPLRWARPFVVGACTRPGDEARLIEAWKRLSPRPTLLLAPRHLDRIGEVTALVGDVRHVRRSALLRSAGDAAPAEVPPDVDVVLLDTIGELAGSLEGAAAAFVGGTFDPRLGGHSPAEAAAQGVPVVRGPHAWANDWSGVTAFEAGDGLADALARAISAPRPAPRRSGATERAMAAIAPWLRGAPAPERAPRPWAWPLVPVRAAADALRGLRRREEVGVPVVIVGSANARGGGKTSTARWAAAELRRQGHRVGVAVRGYRRGRAGRDVRVGGGWEDLGDEGVLFARDGFLVAAGPLVDAARRLASAGVTVVVVDDGLRARIRADFAIEVVDARFPAAGGPIPVGWRRGSGAAPDLVVVHHAGAGSVAGARAVRRLGPWRRGDRAVAPPEGPVVLVCGVARAGDVDPGVAVARRVVLRDHQPFAASLVEELVAGGLPVVCTAKDHARMPAPLRDVAWWRDLVIEVDAEIRLPPPRTAGRRPG